MGGLLSSRAWMACAVTAGWDVLALMEAGDSGSRSVGLACTFPACLPEESTRSEQAPVCECSFAATSIFAFH